MKTLYTHPALLFACDSAEEAARRVKLATGQAPAFLIKRLILSGVEIEAHSVRIAR
jgi:hypothetical protein